jgi:hypothetical protein
LSKARRHVLELFRTRGADAVSFAHNPGAVCVVAPFQAALGVRFVYGAVQHAEHLGGVAAATQDDEQVCGFLWVAAAMADGLAAGRREDEAEAEEQCGCCESGEDGEEDEGAEHSCGVSVDCRRCSLWWKKRVFGPLGEWDVREGRRWMRQATLIS